MSLGKQPLWNAALLGRHNIGLVWVILLLGLTLLAGCGGNSSSSSGGGASRQARVTGRFVDQYNNSQPVAGVTIRSSNEVVQTGADGAFVISVPSNGATLRFDRPTNFYDSAVVNNNLISGIWTNGINIPSLDADSAFPLNDVVIFSNSGPPPPPPL